MANADGMKRYYWEQCYELGDDVHWALCDSESAKEGRVTDYRMVLEHSLATCMDGRPLSEQEIPKLIIDLLNGRERITSLAKRLVEAWKAWADAPGWDNPEWDPFIEVVQQIAETIETETVEQS